MLNLIPNHSPAQLSDCMRSSKASICPWHVCLQWNFSGPSEIVANMLSSYLPAISFFRRYSRIGFPVGLAFSLLLYSPSFASDNSLLRASNMARFKAEFLNGGLRSYRAASCMYKQNGGECLLQRSSNGFLFRFLGGVPGWQQLGKVPTIETEMLVAPDGRSVIQLIYNGPLR